jgi:hypothetical protein
MVHGIIALVQRKTAAGALGEIIVRHRDCPAWPPITNDRQQETIE